MGSLLFALLTFGLTLVVGMLVAAMIKLIGVIVQRKRAPKAVPNASPTVSTPAVASSAGDSKK